MALKKMSDASADKAIATLGLEGKDAAVMKNILTKDKAIAQLGSTRDELAAELADQIKAKIKAKAISDVLKANGMS